MTQRIKITGYIYVDDIEPEDLDLSHAMGVSGHGYETGLSRTTLQSLDDIEYELMDEE